MADMFKANKEARRAASRQRTLIAEQKFKDRQKLSDADDEIARRKASTTSGAGGRSLLVATKQQGLSKTLGG